MVSGGIFVTARNLRKWMYPRMPSETAAPVKRIDMTMVAIAEADYVSLPEESPIEIEAADPEKLAEAIRRLEEEMREAARKFEFEKAAQLRDKARSLRAKLV